MYVDDLLCIGNEKAINSTVKQLQENDLMVTIEDELKDYLSCEIIISNDQSEAWLGQPHLIKNLDKEFGREVENLQQYKTAGTPTKGIV